MRSRVYFLACNGYHSTIRSSVMIMVQTEIDIPEFLRGPALAGVAWINEKNNTSYELTGLVDVEKIKDIKLPFELGLVLCDGEICTREQVLFKPSTEGYTFERLEADTPDIPPLLDPPVGVRRNWIERQLKNCEFIVLLYYRGLW